MEKPSSWPFIALFLNLTFSIPQAFAAKPAATISGVSSGAYMAVQMHLAHSSSIQGVGAVAGGVFWCAQGSPQKALSDCMKAAQDTSASKYIAKAQSYEMESLIDPLTYLFDDQVFIFSGEKDGVVSSGTG
jgi:hypothetical protein